MFKMDMRYTNGKIYKLVSNVTGDVYYGSTIQNLKYRLSGHKTQYKRYLQGKGHYVTSFKILETDDYDIYLVEDYVCLCKKQLEEIERIYVENYKCINKVIPNRTRKESNKAYREKNKTYYKEYMNKYRKKNKDKLYKRAGKKIDCVCGSKVRRSDFATHIKTNKHQKYINKI